MLDLVNIPTMETRANIFLSFGDFRSTLSDPMDQFQTPKKRTMKRFDCSTSSCSSIHMRSMEEIQSISHSSICSLSQTNLELMDELVDVMNVVDLPFRDEDMVVKFMRSRYLNKEFYTWAGQALLVVHPYEETKHYDGNTVDIPSIKSLVGKVWFMLQRGLGKQHQSVVFSGESGSGKTYSTCMALKHIASKLQDCGGAAFEEILWQIWSSVPLLTAFGNASTSHNSDSSRFCRLIQLQFSGNNVEGASVKTYLLEKSRVTGPNSGEGNFHIFRQILDTLDAETLAPLCLSKDTEYKIAPKVGVWSNYTKTVKALETLNITDLDKILVILSVVLNLGNVQFELSGDSYTAATSTYKYVSNVSKLLNVSDAELRDVLCNSHFCTKNIARRNTTYKMPCMNREECEERRNSMMKFLYDRLFSWLVDCVNARTFCDGNTHKHLSLLDIFGFEVFDENTFEQLCINYANERLQQYFMRNYLVERRDELMSEGLVSEFIDVSDYASRIAVIDGSISIFGLLNEECAVKRFNNDIFVNSRLVENLRGRDHFIGPLNDLNSTFSIVHYAGIVKYNTKSMLSKNKDKVPEEIIAFLKGCKFAFVGEVIGGNDEANRRTLVTSFKRSLDELFVALDAGHTHYVKCLKPNPYKISEFFDEDFFLQQLATNGVIELLKLNYQKYPIRLNYKKFLRIFTEKLFENLKHVLNEEYHIGSTRIYLTQRAYHTIERLLHLQRSSMCRKIQRCWSNRNRRRVVAAIAIQRFYRRHLRIRSSFERFADTTNGEGLRFVCESRTELYVRQHDFDAHAEGDQLSLKLERVFSECKTKKFRRTLFCGDRIVSYHRLAEIPVRFHARKTCIRNSHLLPKSELPKGLEDIF